MPNDARNANQGERNKAMPGYVVYQETIEKKQGETNNDCTSREDLPAGAEDT